MSQTFDISNFDFLAKPKFDFSEGLLLKNANLYSSRKFLFIAILNPDNDKNKDI